MKPTSRHIAEAVWRMSEVIPFFPRGEAGMAMVQSAMERFVSTKEQLDWLTVTACDVMQRFSLPELRGIFCTRFAPADGVYTAAESPGYTPEDAMSRSEMTYHERQGQEYQEKLAEWKRENLLTGEVAASDRHNALPPGTNRIKPAPFVREPDSAERRARLKDAEETLAEQKRRIPVRTEEEKARMIRELEEQLGIAKKAARPEPGV